MKRKGFTLAEVLVVLTIIGVVATLTVPQVAQNIQDAQLRSAWKKEYAILDQVTNQIMFENGGTLVGAFDCTTFTDKYLAKLNIAKKCANWEAGCWHEPTGFKSALLSDGTALAFQHVRDDCSHTDWTSVPICGTLEVDVNGVKGPNLDGKDLFTIEIRKNSAVPSGTDGAMSSGANCIYLNTTNADGRACAMWYLRR